jgi:NAD(P)H-quinone oxidoreductase subunit 5
MSTLFTRLTWGLFGISAGALGLYSTLGLDLPSGPLVHVDGLALLMAAVITFVSGIVHSFARRYMAGQRHLNRFYARLFGLTLVVLLLAAANHIVLFVGLWTAMGWLLADLIGHLHDWPQARAASRHARRTFLGGSALVALALGGLGGLSGAWTVRGLLAALGTLPAWSVGTAGGLLLGAAMVQSALVPFHRWLLSSMTAPTPVSAFMHAGLVNAGGLLLARFAPVVFELPVVVWSVVLAGGGSALLGQAWMLVQTDVKRQLACSTVAQMGFMILQVGLGFVPAAIAHLILHGFYKAYFFLASGSVVEHSTPPSATASRSSLAHGLVVGLSAIAGGAAFATLTGKSLTALNSGTLLTLFVVLAVLHATQTAVRRAQVSASVRFVAVPVGLLAAVGIYAGVYNGIALLLADLPMALAPTALTPVHWVLAGAFVLAYVALQRGWHRTNARLYTTLLNTSQPLPSTLLTQRTQYHA